MLTPHSRGTSAVCQDSRSSIGGPLYRLKKIGGLFLALGCFLQPHSLQASPTYRWEQVTIAPAASFITFSFDTRRGHFLRFGGSLYSSLTGNVDTNELWAFDQEGWHFLAADLRPPPRRAAMSVFDKKRGKLVVFGGVLGGTNTYLQDTWEWDGARWEEKKPIETPTARIGAGLVYDEQLGKIILYGGTSNWISAALSDMWDWDGTNWNEIPLGDSPGAVTNHAMVYDSKRDRTVLFGGYDVNAASPGTWEWDGSTWTEKSKTQPFDYEFTQNVWAAFDGDKVIGVLPQAGDFDGVTWSWNGESWTQHDSAPTGYSDGGIAWDDWNKEVVHVSGDDYYDDGDAPRVSVWNGTTWKEVVKITPQARYGHTLVDDQTRQQLVLFGGKGEAMLYDDTWVWDGKLWINPSPATHPTARFGHGAAFDAQRGVTVVFGGTDGSSSLGDTWEWDGQTWEQKSAEQAPPARFDHSMSFDPTSNKVILQGGRGPLALGDTWSWDGDTWELVATSNDGPKLRYGSAMVTNAETERVALFGGSYDMYLSDTWQWSMGMWQVEDSSPVPSPRRDHALSTMGKSLSNGKEDPDDVTVDEIVLFGGVAGETLGDTWYFGSEGWRQEIDPRQPNARSEHAMSYDAARNVIVLFGGTTGTKPLRDMWFLKRYGNHCETDSDCGRGGCVDGVCCPSKQCGICESCATIGHEGECYPVTKQVDQDSCHGDFACNETAECVRVAPCLEAESCAGAAGSGQGGESGSGGAGGDAGTTNASPTVTSPNNDSGGCHLVHGPARAQITGMAFLSLLVLGKLRSRRDNGSPAFGGFRLTQRRSDQ